MAHHPRRPRVPAGAPRVRLSSTWTDPARSASQARLSPAGRQGPTGPLDRQGIGPSWWATVALRLWHERWDDDPERHEHEEANDAAVSGPDAEPGTRPAA